MRKKVDFKKLVGQYVNCDELYYKILEPIIHNGKTVGAKTHLVCPAKHSNAWTDFHKCGFFFRECDLFYCDIYENMSVVSREEVIQHIKQLTKDAIEKFL